MCVKLFNHTKSNAGDEGASKEPVTFPQLM